MPNFPLMVAAIQCDACIYDAGVIVAAQLHDTMKGAETMLMRAQWP